MRKLLQSGAVIAATFAMTAPAHAVTVSFSPLFGFPAGVTPTTFKTFDPPATTVVPDGTQYIPPAGAQAAPAGPGGAFTFTETRGGAGTDLELYTGNVPGESVDPAPGVANGQYLAVQNGTYTVSFGTALQFFSFVFGSLDNYNTLRVNFGNGTNLSLQGAQIPLGTASVGGVPVPIGPTNIGTSGRLSFDTGGNRGGITSVVFGSSNRSFEIDSLAGAVPEPSTWGMMILGFGAAGYAMRVRRRRKLGQAFA